MIATYARVSGEEQAQKGYSLSDQISSCKQLAGEICREYIDDGYSGEFLERPGLDRLREDIFAGIIDTVIMYDPDRMSRNLTNQLILADELEKSGVKLRFVTGDYYASPEGRLFFSMKGAISAYEKGKIRERTTRGKRKKVMQNKILQPNTPYGYDWDEINQTYTINEKESEVIKLIYKMYNNRIGTIDISKILTSKGIFNRFDKTFNTNMIWRIVSNERYTGIAWQFVTKTIKISQYQNKRSKTPREDQLAVEVPVIINKDIFDTARIISIENARLSKRNIRQEYLLRGILICGLCGHTMIGTPTTVNGKTYRYYVCGKNKSSYYYQNRCSNMPINTDKIENAIWDRMVHEVADGSFQKIESKTEPNTSSVLSKKIDEITKKKKEIMKWFRDGLIESSDAEIELKKIQSEIDNLSSALSLANKKINKKAPTIITAEQMSNAKSTEEKWNIFILADIKFKVIRNAKTLTIEPI